MKGPKSAMGQTAAFEQCPFWDQPLQAYDYNSRRSCAFVVPVSGTEGVCVQNGPVGDVEGAVKDEEESPQRRVEHSPSAVAAGRTELANK